MDVKNKMFQDRVKKAHSRVFFFPLFLRYEVLHYSHNLFIFKVVLNILSMHRKGLLTSVFDCLYCNGVYNVLCILMYSQARF